MLWAILAILFAIVGLIGFFTLKILFWIGGGVCFLFLVHYLYSKNRDLDQYEKLITEEQDEENQSLTKKRKNIDKISLYIVYGLALIILFFFFKWDAFCWIGIVFGLLYIPEAIHFIKTGELRG